MRVRPASPEEGARPRSFLQCAFWGDFKSRFGWKSLRFIAESGSGGEDRTGGAALLVLVRSLGLGFSFAYVPHGPEPDPGESSRGAFLAELGEALRPCLPPSCLFIRFDPPWASLDGAAGGGADEGAGEAGEPKDAAALAEDERPRVGPPLRRAAADVQVPDTILVDLEASEEEMLSRMKPKWRYNVRLAAKKGVEVEEAGADEIPEFYRLYRATAARDRIALHPESYYRRLFEVAADAAAAGSRDAPDLRLWIARKDGEALAAIVTLFRGTEAVYLYGASADRGRELMPAYALQWAAMRAAKAAGCSEYDLFGIPPSDDPSHPMAGLYRFKSGFGGRVARRAGSWDYALRPMAYGLFRIAEGARRWWHKDARKSSRKAARARSG